VNKERKITYKMIEVAIDKALRDIEENPERGIRNLVELLAQLSSGRFLKDFLTITQQMLSNSESPYYELTRHVIKNVDHSLLKNFSLRFGYNSLTYGANKIREYEKKFGYNVPWTLVFDLRQTLTGGFSVNDISNVLQQGEKIGIYCAIFIVDHNQVVLKELINTLASHNEGAYFVFADPEMLNNEMADLIFRAGNIAAVLLFPLAESKASYNEATGLLMGKKCLYGTCIEYNDDNYIRALEATYSEEIKNAHSTFVFLIGNELQVAEDKQRFSRFIQKAKNANEHPFFLTDFYEGLAHVDRTISVEDCFLAIISNGCVAVNSLDNVCSNINIQKNSLKDIMKKTMPKTSYI